LDLSSTVTIYAIVTWRLIVHIMNYLGYIDEKWIKNKDNIELDNNNKDQVFWRKIYFLGLFVITMPLFLKKSMDSL